MGESWDRWALVRANCNPTSVRPLALSPSMCGEFKAMLQLDGQTAVMNSRFTLAINQTH